MSRLPTFRPDRGDRARRRLPAAAATRAAAARAAHPRRLRRRDRRAAADPLPAARAARRPAARRAGPDLARGRAAVPALPRDRVARAAARGRARRGLPRPRRRRVTLSILAIIGVTGAALGIGTYGVRLARTTSDLFVASRAVTPWWNAAAISGEYLSAASFLGVAGLMLKFGASALWLPVGFTAGYLTLLLVRRRAAAALRLLHDPGLRRGAPARALHAAARRRDRAADQRLLPRAAAQGRGRDAARRHRCAVLGRRRARGRDRRAQRRARRDARRDLRAGLPVLGQGVRDRVPGDPAADPPRRPARERGAVRLRATRAPGRTGWWSSSTGRAR